MANKNNSTQEKVEIMKAFLDGKTIQYYNEFLNAWENVKEEPVWNWRVCRYRIMPSLKYRPYRSASEFLAAMKEHGGWLRRIVEGSYGIPVSFDEYGVQFIVDQYSYAGLLDNFVWCDDMPCGVKDI